jgi:Cu+-exporting ATPase
MHDHTMPPSEGTSLDPVCGMTVVTEGAQQISEYQGTTYYFCGKGCRLDFEEDPERILAPEYRPSM